MANTAAAPLALLPQPRMRRRPPLPEVCPRCPNRRRNPPDSLTGTGFEARAPPSCLRRRFDDEALENVTAFDFARLNIATDATNFAILVSLCPTFRQLGPARLLLLPLLRGHRHALKENEFIFSNPIMVENQSTS